MHISYVLQCAWMLLKVHRNKLLHCIACKRKTKTNRALICSTAGDEKRIHR